MAEFGQGGLGYAAGRTRQPMTNIDSNSSPSPRWFVRGDIDGFFGLALDNLIQVLLISSLWTQVLGFSSAGLYGRVRAF